MLDSEHNIALIGGGNLASAMLSGLIKQGYPRDRLMVCAPSQNTRTALHEQFHIRTEKHNDKAIAFADVVILAVQPDPVPEVCIELQDGMLEHQANPLVLCAVTGINHDFLRSALSPCQRVVLASPSLPSAVCRGFAALYAGEGTDANDMACAERLMSALGPTRWVSSEAQLTAMATTAGNVPMYMLQLLESVQRAAAEQGLDEEVARQTIIQSALGVLSLAAGSNESFRGLRDKVTTMGSPSNQSAVQPEQQRLDDIIFESVQCAANQVDDLYAKY